MTSRDLRRFAFFVVLLFSLGCPIGFRAQVSDDQRPAAAAGVAAVDSAPATLRYFNRPITVFRASILARAPEERAAAAAANLDRLVKQGAPLTISTRPLMDMVVISIGGTPVFALAPQDVDALSHETLESKVAETETNLKRALDEAVEARTTPRMLRNTGELLLGSAVFLLLLRVAKRLHVKFVPMATMLAEQQLSKLSTGRVLVRESRAGELCVRSLNLVFVVVAGILGFSWLTFSLRRFPYTRPLGESLRVFLFGRAAALGGRILDALPDLFVVLIIVIVTRFLVRLSNRVFRAVEAEQIEISGLYPETAHATERLVGIFLWLLAILVAYPYVPGSNSDVFKGISVLVGLMVSLGSRGIVDQMMSGLLLTYSRAVRIGDFVKIANVEGTIVETAALSTKVKTPRGEEVTIPNSVVVADVTLNYTRFQDTEGVYVPTVVSIGYETPWRQVQALLQLAAARTPGVAKRPAPIVRQNALGDFSVQYTLLVCLEKPLLVGLEKPQQRGAMLSALHANILDAFNDYGVQIMTPHYEGDPLDHKVVPRDRWYATPAAPPSSIELSQPAVRVERT